MKPIRHILHNKGDVETYIEAEQDGNRISIKRICIDYDCNGTKGFEADRDATQKARRGSTRRSGS
jgi:hypothetical protein